MRLLEAIEKKADLTGCDFSNENKKKSEKNEKR